MDQRMSGKTTEPIPAISRNSPILSPRSSFVVVQAPDKLFCSTLPTPPGSNRPSWEVTKGVEELYSEVISHRSGRGPRERLVLHVPLDKFKELRKRLEEYPGRLRYNYDYMNEKIISFPNPSAVHESTTKFFREIMASKMSSNLAQINSGLVWAHWGSQTTRLTSNGRKTHDKGADEAYYVRSGELDVIPLFPAFVVEVGYSETIEELLEDVAHWLCQSQGYVLAVLVVKFNKPTCEENFHDIMKWQAWMQIYVQSRKDPSKIVKSGPRINFIPPSNETIPLEIPIDYILTPPQMDALQLTDEQRNSTYSFDPRKIVPETRVAIKVMACRSYHPTILSPMPRKRKLSREEEET